MKRLYTVLFLFLLSGTLCGQHDKPCIPCLPQGIIFTTQEQIDNFRQNFPGCTTIQGDVRVSEASHGSITNLKGLNSLTAVEGNLLIYFNFALPCLEGLNNLTSIGDNLSVIENPALASLEGLEKLASVGEALFISKNAALTSLSALFSLTSLRGSLSLGNNHLASLKGLSGLASVGGRGICLWEDGLASLAGLENIDSVDGSLIIEGCNSLPDLTGFNRLRHIRGDLEISRNAALFSLSGLDYLDAGTVRTLVIKDNPLLSVCNVKSICEFLHLSDHAVIENNAPGCSSYAQVDSACAPASAGERNPPEDFRCYPNPAFNTITLETPSWLRLRIVGPDGRQLREMQVSGLSAELNIRDLPKGFYVMIITGDRWVTTRKLVKQ